MDEQIVLQIVDELLSSLEPLETQNAALLQFLKAKGFATDEELAPFLEQAANTSNVRWRTVRVRTAALISNAMKPPETTPTKNMQTAPQPSTEAKKEMPQEQESQREQGESQREEEQKKAAANTNKGEEPETPLQPTQQTEQDLKSAKSEATAKPKETPKQKAA
jgi:hypothetical protein